MWSFFQAVSAFPEDVVAPQPSFEVSSALLFVFIYFLGTVLVSLLGWYLLRYWLRQRRTLPHEFHLHHLLILVPQAGKEEMDKQDSLQIVQEKIGVAESLYAVIGGLKPHKGPLTWLYGRHDHLSLEIVAKDGLIYFYIAVPFYLRKMLEEQIHAQYPEAHIEDVEDYNIFQPRGVVIGTYMVLDRPSVFPIKTYKEMESDPLSAITHTLSKVKKEDGAVIQFVIRSAHKSWRRAGVKIATEMQQGKKLSEAMGQDIVGRVLMAPFKFIQFIFSTSKKPEGMETEKERYQLSPMETEMVKRLEAKASKAGLDVNVRVVVSSADTMTAQSYLNDILQAFSQYSIYQYGNRFKKSAPYSKQALVRQFIYRDFNERKKIVLNTEELASAYHFPLPSTDTPTIVWLAARKAAPPSRMPTQGLVLGETEFRGETVQVKIKKSDRRRHMYIIGRSGVGKSVLMRNMVIQDIEAGEGVGVVDPHGDLVEEILPFIPENRIRDVIYFNPSDIERPIGLNMLEAKTPEEMDFATQEMVSIFYKLVTDPSMIGPMFEHNMRNVMLTLMANPEHPGTIADIPRMFTDPAFQKYNLQFVKDPMVKAFWEKEMAQTSDFHKSEMLGYLISKVGRFVENEMIRNIIGQPKSGFGFQEVMDQQKILLVNLSKGTTGEVNSSLLGLIMVSKLQMAALARAAQTEEKRKDFYLYIDEFQNFVTDSIATILSEARKYRLNLTIAHQYIMQLVKNQDTSIKDAVLGNAGTIVSFRIGVEDAEVLEKEFEPIFTANDLINIERFTAYIKLLIDNTASRPFNMKTYPPPSGGSAERVAAVKEFSRFTYGRPREEVQREIMTRTKLGESSTKASTPPEASL